MIIVGENLIGLIKQYEICETKYFDQYSISLELDELYIKPCLEKFGQPLTYDLHSVESYFETCRMEQGILSLKPGEMILGCSTVEINMPIGYMGLVQTKGSLARLFVSSVCSDSQIEPGFKGKVTLEIINHSPFEICLPYRSKVAQLFVVRCSTSNIEPYNGRYKNATCPTISVPGK